jgi:hypothetical protein
MTDGPKNSLLAIGSPHHEVNISKKYLTSQVAPPLTSVRRGFLRLRFGADAGRRQAAASVD